MKYILLSLLCGCLFALTGCGGTVFTPEFIDPADSSSASAPPEPSLPEPSGPSASQETVLPSGPPEQPSTSEREIKVTLTADTLSPFQEEKGFLYADYTLSCDAENFADAGLLSYRLVQMEGEDVAAQNFNAYYQKDMGEWKDSVLSAARDGASFALEDGFPMEPYQVTLTASVLPIGGVVSVTRLGTQKQGENEPFPFAMNECFEAGTGRQLTLWDLFTAEKEDVQPRLLAAMQEQARSEAVLREQGLLDSASDHVEEYFSPSDFSCGENGFEFYLLAPELLREPELKLTVLTVPYTEVADILRYPLA